MKSNPNTPLSINSEAHSPKGNNLSVVLILIPILGFAFAALKREAFIPPVDLESFLTSFVSVALLFYVGIFFLSFMKSPRSGVLYVMFVFLGFFWLAGGFAFAVTANMHFDKSPGEIFERKVIATHKSSGSMGKSGSIIKLCQILVEPWGEFSSPTWLRVDCRRLTGMTNKNVRFQAHQGFLNFVWIQSVEVVQ